MDLKFINESKNAPKPVGPYSVAVRLDNTLYCSGQIGIDPETDKLVEGFEAQMNRSLANIQAVLEASGSSIEKIVMATIFLKDFSNYAKANEIYSNYINLQNPPARQTIGVKELPAGAEVEISVVAAVRKY